MKKNAFLILCCTLFLFACGGAKTVKPSPAAKPASASTQASSPSALSKPGGYYLDDGPGDNPPQNIDSIPSAIPKNEPYLVRTNKPYRALGSTYTPMTSWQPYKERGVASWYGKRYHGKKTASGEVYDMYSMSAAHTTLPLPSYVKVTNPANGRFVIVRLNDRGPFKGNRIIDLSYAAAYQLRFASVGSTVVEIEAINPDNAASYNQATSQKSTITQQNSVVQQSPVTQTAQVNIAATSANIPSATIQYFVQAGAFKNLTNAESLAKRIQALEIAPNVGINSVYNNDLYRLKLGPYNNKPEAELTAAKIRRQLSLPTIIINQ